jgi:hypothetical protein
MIAYRRENANRRRLLADHSPRIRLPFKGFGQLKTVVLTRSSEQDSVVVPQEVVRFHLGPQRLGQVEPRSPVSPSLHQVLDRYCLRRCDAHVRRSKGSRSRPGRTGPLPSRSGYCRPASRRSSPVAQTPRCGCRLTFGHLILWCGDRLLRH